MSGVLVVGSAHLDVLAQARSRDDVLDKIGDVQINVGGTAANVAINIAHEGITTRFLSAMNRSPYSALIADNLSTEGVDVLIDYHTDLPMAAFCAHMDTSGEMTSAVSATPVERVKFSDERILGALAEMSAAILDCNLSIAMLNRIVTLANDVSVPVYVCAVSEEKSLRVGAITGRLKGVFLNTKEFAFFSRHGLGGAIAPLEAAVALRSLLVVTAGAKGSALADPAGGVHHVAPANLQHQGTRLGMGDALAAGLVVGHEVLGLPLEAAGRYAMRMVEAVGHREHCHLGERRAFEDVLEQVRHRADHDTMTGAMNRAHTERILALALESRRRHEASVAVLLLDIDHFKSVNDTYGHNVGDEVIKAVARAAQSCLRETDRLGRWGGEEFLIILPETDLAAAHLVAERVRATVEASIREPRPVTISVGVAQLIPDGSVDSHAFVESADSALYEAKRGGRNRVICATACIA